MIRIISGTLSASSYLSSAHFIVSVVHNECKGSTAAFEAYAAGVSRLIVQAVEELVKVPRDKTPADPSGFVLCKYQKWVYGREISVPQRAMTCVAFSSVQEDFGERKEGKRDPLLNGFFFIHSLIPPFTNWRVHGVRSPLV